MYQSGERKRRLSSSCFALQSRLFENRSICSVTFSGRMLEQVDTRGGKTLNF